MTNIDWSAITGVIAVLTTITSVAGAVFALKYKAQSNKEKNQSTEDNFEKFKQFVYKELKSIESEMQKNNILISNLLSKTEAEEKYLTRREHDAIMKNIDSNLKNILKTLDDMKDKK